MSRHLQEDRAHHPEEDRESANEPTPEADVEESTEETATEELA